MASLSSADVLSLLQKGKKLRKLLLKTELKLLGRSSSELYTENNPDDALCLSILEKYNMSSRSLLNYHFSPSRKLLAAQTEANKTVIVNVNNGGIINTVIGNLNQILLPNENTLLYVTKSTNERPHQVWSHLLQGQESTLLYQENNESMQLNLAQTRDKKFITITSVSRLCSEVRIIPVSMELPFSSPVLIKEAVDDYYYFIDSAHGRLYIMTNYYSQKSDYQLMTSSYKCASEWKPFYVPDDNFIVQDIELFDTFIVIYGNKWDPVLPAIVIYNIESKASHEIVFEDFTHLLKPANIFLSDTVKLVASSVISPPKHITVTNKGDVSFKDRRNTKIKLRHIKATANDGVTIPITLFYDSEKIKMNGSDPILISAYGCHGISLYTGYDETLFPLLRRGWILAYCHIRGGGELGRQWHFDAIRKKKLISFNDLICCISHLHDNGYSSPGRTAVQSRSSGSLCAAGACNVNPEIMEAVILEMPLVNLKDNLLNKNHYINSMDSQEFGNPRTEKTLVESICPFHNLRMQDYPSFFITASTIDPLVTYSSVERYANKLKCCIEQYRTATTGTTDTSNNGKIRRGTVILHKETQSSHYWANRSAIQKQALLKLMFLMNAVRS